MKQSYKKCIYIHNERESLTTSHKMITHTMTCSYNQSIYQSTLIYIYVCVCVCVDLETEVMIMKGYNTLLG